MTKRETNETRRRLLREMVAEYNIKTIGELEKTLKEMFAGTMSDMLKGELDAHLGYEKSSKEPKATTNRRNGSYSKQVRTSMGEAEISIPHDRDGEFEPKLVPNGTRDISGIEEKVLSMYAKGMRSGGEKGCILRNRNQHGGSERHTGHMDQRNGGYAFLANDF